MSTRIWTPVAVSFVTTLILAVSCAKKEVTPEPILRPVRVQQVFAGGGSRTRTFSGVAQSGVESKISFKVSGTVQSVPVNVGISVTRGQLIAQLDDADYRLQVQDAEASLSKAKAGERNALASYERVRGLYENRNASRQELESSRAAYESAAANVRSLGKRLELARNQLAYCSLRAPIDGSVAAVNVEINENVRAGQVIVLLTSGSDIQVEVAIPELLIAQIKEGDQVSIAFDALPGRELPGRVTEVGVAATGTATTFPVTVLLDDASDDIRSGMAAEVAFRFESPGGAEHLLVPPVAISEDRDGRFVYVVEKSDKEGVGIVRRRPVDLGDWRNAGVEVREGLADGDFVVTAGVSKITDGMEVQFNAHESGEQ